MRVVRSSVYRRYTSSLNDLQSNLNKSMNKVSTGAAYETAADNPLAYYQGKKMDHLYQDAKSKSSILGDIKNRLYQQEQGARDIQKTLSNSRLPCSMCWIPPITAQKLLSRQKEMLFFRMCRAWSAI